jgi:hypothetical protein
MAALASSSCITDPGGTGHSRPISIGISRRNAPLIGLSAGTISVWNSTRLKRAGASTGCTSIAATETRAPNPLWRSCFRSLNSSSPKMCSRASGSQSPPKNRRPALSRYSYQSQPMSIAVTRTTTILKPDQSRVLLRPFIPGDSQRISRVITRIVSLPENQVGLFSKKSRPNFHNATNGLLSSLGNASNNSVSCCWPLGGLPRTQAVDRLLHHGRILSGVCCALQPLHSSAPGSIESPCRRTSVRS